MAYLRLRNLSVEFPIYQGGSRSLKKSLLAKTTQGNIGRDTHNRVNIRALSDVNLDIEHGDRLALMGANGAGKSTLLKVLAGIYEPTRGRLHASGRVSALLTASVGLDPDATGRENIILRGMYMDIHPREMRGRVDSIAEFTELGDHLDLPVRTYSSGMMIRLCFAVATAVPPEILLMDEWLAAGDAGFLAKARRRMEEFVGRSSILVLASHSIPILEEWCNRAILLDRGNIAASGRVSHVAEVYQRGSAAPAALPAERQG